MRKHIQSVIIVILCITVIVFGGLWQNARNDLSDIEQLAQYGAYNACAKFMDFEKSEDESDYWSGVSNFHTFQTSYFLLVEDTNKRSNFTFCNEVYGKLTNKPEETQQYISEIIEVMQILSEDVSDENGYMKMFELGNLLKH